MKSVIHPTAVVSQKAELAADVEIGPYTLVGPHAKIGAGTRIGSHVVIEGRVRIGKRCRIFTGACLGFPAQTLGPKEADASVEIGDDNILREYVTVNAAMKDAGRTVIGHRNMLMINAHIAHDCVLGNDIVIANNVALAGHVTVEDRAVLGGLVGVHQFARIGKLAMVGGLSKVVMDIAPFSLNDGRPAAFCGLNAIGLRRAGLRPAQITPIKAALKLLFGHKQNLKNILPKVKKQFAESQEVQYLLSFIETSKRGVTRVSGSHSGFDG